MENLTALQALMQAAEERGQQLAAVFRRSWQEGSGVIRHSAIEEIAETRDATD